MALFFQHASRWDASDRSETPSYTYSNPFHARDAVSYTPDIVRTITC